MKFNKRKLILTILTIGVFLTGCGGKKNAAQAPEATPSPTPSAITEQPTQPTQPTQEPTNVPSASPSQKPSQKPTVTPTQKPTIAPTQKPTGKPTVAPTPKPTVAPTPKPSQSTSAKEINNTILNGINSPASQTMPDDMIKDSYGIDLGLLDSYEVKMPMMMVQASEVAVFKVKDVKDIAKVTAGINKRQAALNDIWKQYLPDQYELVKNKKIVTKGNYVLYCISEEAEKIVANFNKVIQ